MSMRAQMQCKQCLVLDSMFLLSILVHNLTQHGDVARPEVCALQSSHDVVLTYAEGLSLLCYCTQNETNAPGVYHEPMINACRYVYWRLLSTDPEAAKDVVLAEKPVIADNSAALEPSLLQQLLSDLSTLASVRAAFAVPCGMWMQSSGEVVARVGPAACTQECLHADVSLFCFSDLSAHEIILSTRP